MTHARTIGVQGAADDDVLASAASEQRVPVTTDADSAILALSGAAAPRVLLLRGVGDSVDERVSAILYALPAVEHDLTSSAVAVVETDCIRLRGLPINDD